MIATLLQRVGDGWRTGTEVDLRVRIFRLACAVAGALCLLVVAPLNAFQSLPLAVHVGNLLLGLLALWSYVESCLGRHRFGLFIGGAVLLLDVVWFANAGSDGSVTLYYFPVLLFVLTIFDAPWRWWLAAGVWLNVGLLLVLEWCVPGLVTPFQSRFDRFLDMQTGVLCSLLGLACVAVFMIRSYDWEQGRVSRIAAELAKREANYRAIFNSTSDALFIHQVDGLILDVNERACLLFAATRDQMIGRRVGDFSIGQGSFTQERASGLARAALAGPEQIFEWCCRDTTGRLFWAEVALRAWEFEGEQRLVGAVRDITSRRQAMEEIRANEERLRLAMESSHQGWFDLNLRTGETISSPEYVRMLGYEPGEFRSSYAAWVERVHPSDRDETVRQVHERLASGDQASLEYRQRTKSGAWKWFRSTAKVVERDAAGKAVRVMGTHADITERKELEGQLLHSQRLEAVGTLASGVAHDLNNILTPMLMASGILRDKLTDAKDRELMTLLDEGGRRGAAIVRKLLAFSRNLAEDLVPTDPRQAIREMAQLIRSSFPKEIRVVEAVADVPGLVEVEPNQLQQVLLNLCVNARDAMPGGGTITLGLERAETVAGTEGRSGPYLVLTVADTGCGIPPDVLPKIFDPFFTTKPVGQGTGLGLSSVHGIVKAHRGFVRVESQPGQGAVFRVYLPARDGAAEVPAAPVSEPAADSPATTTVLVIDDDEAVRLTTSRLLERLGCDVLTAASGREALDRLREHRAVVQVAITDFSMPEMDGPTLVPQLLALRPGLRVIGVSGLNQAHRLDELTALGFSEILAKPYLAADLVAAVRRQIASVPGPR